MGDLRDAVETFYKRDHVEIIEETLLKEMTFFTDINFTHQMRVSQIRWHPTIPGVVAMSMLESKEFETYLQRLTTKLVMTNMLLIWSISHPLFPQVHISYLLVYLGNVLMKNFHIYLKSMYILIHNYFVNSFY